MSEKDIDLIRRAKAGSKRAFDQLVRKYTSYIYYLLLDMTGNTEDARDLTQETFIKAYLNLDKFREEAKFSTWIYRIAYNLGIDFHHEKKVRMTSSTEGNAFARALSVRNEIQDPYLSAALQKGLQSLSEQQKAAVVLYYNHEMTVPEIAEIMKCAPATVRVHIHRGLSRLRFLLKKYQA